MEKKAPKKPSITQTGPKVFYDNHVDAEFVFKAEDLHMNDGYFISQAKNCKFDFQGKVLNIFLDKCTNVQITCSVNTYIT